MNISNNGIIAFVFGLLVLPLNAMELKICGEQVILSGKVEGNEYGRVSDAFSKNPNLKVVVLRNSPGGDADTGYKLGEFFRQNGITTYLSGYCRSSCSRLFLGGKARYFTDDSPALQFCENGNNTLTGRLQANWKCAASVSCGSATVVQYCGSNACLQIKS